MQCNFCLNKFSGKTSLNQHQKTAKYCLQIQGIKLKKYICDSCGKDVSTKHRLSTHYQSCEKYKEQQYTLNFKQEKQQYIDKIEELKDRLAEKEKHIEKLEDKLENIAIKAVSRSTTTKNTQINNYINQLQPITDSNFTDNVQNLTIDHILKGPEGYAEYALEFPLKDRVLCVDYSRRKVKFKDKDGHIITDPEMSNLATKFFNSIKDKNKELIIECSDKLKENFGDEIDTIVKIFDYKTGVERSSDGEKTEFHHDFVKHMCCKTIKD